MYGRVSLLNKPYFVSLKNASMVMHWTKVNKLAKHQHEHVSTVTLATSCSAKVQPQRASLLFFCLLFVYHFQTAIYPLRSLSASRRLNENICYGITAVPPSFCTLFILLTLISLLFIYSRMAAEKKKVSVAQAAPPLCLGKKPLWIKTSPPLGDTHSAAHAKHKSPTHITHTTGA